MKKYKYFLLAAVILAADQITKILIVKYIPLHSIGWSFSGDFFRLIHVRNLGMAFSLGNSFPPLLKTVVMIILPLSVLSVIGVQIVRNSNLTNDQRWIFAVILGGGLGNQIDRIFRQEGVVDFLDFKFYGLLGMERWPTFNIADSSLVISMILLILFQIIQEVRLKKNHEQEA